MPQDNARGTDPRITNLADDIAVLLGKHPKPIAVEALSQIVGLMCMTKSREESRASLTDFMSAAEQKRGMLEELFAFKK